MDKIFRRTKVTKFSDGDEKFCPTKILSDIVLSDKIHSTISSTIKSFRNFRIIILLNMACLGNKKT